MLLCTYEEYVLSRVPVNSISAYSHEQAELFKEKDAITLIVFSCWSLFL